MITLPCQVINTNSWGVYMQWIVGHEPEFRLVLIYIKYWDVVNSLQWDIELISKLDFEGASTLMGPNGPCSKLYHDGIIYKN